MSQPEKTAVRNRETGKIETVETASIPTGLDALAAFVDLPQMGLPPSKTAWTDMFALGPIRFKIRPVGKDVLLANDSYLKHVIAELGLEEIAESYQDFSVFPNPEAARFQAAVEIYNNESYRIGNPALSLRADELIVERYEQMLLGIDNESDDPAKWGGLVGWNIDGVSASKFPFTPDNVKALNIQTKASLFDRLIPLSRQGVNDAQFRRTRGI